MSNIKYDDTDYLINREESIEYKISDTNVGSIEEDIMSEEAFNELIDNFEIVGTLTEYGRRAIKQNVKKLQKRIKELEEENKIYALNGDNVRLEIYIKNNYIPVQKVKDLEKKIINCKIARAYSNGYYYDRLLNQEYIEVFRNLFKKLLEV